MAHFLTLKPLQSPQSLIRPTLLNLLFNGYSCWYCPDYISLVLMLFEPQSCLLKNTLWAGLAEDYYVSFHSFLQRLGNLSKYFRIV